MTEHIDAEWVQIDAKAYEAVVDGAVVGLLQRKEGAWYWQRATAPRDEELLHADDVALAQREVEETLWWDAREADLERGDDD